ncbi:MAG: SBBP repeat-containing protein, partial [Terriglobales bacterium]
SLYIADSSSNQVIVARPQAGVYTPVLRAPGMNQPQGIAVDSSGNIYVADRGDNRLLQLQTSTVGFGALAVVASAPRSHRARPSPAATAPRSSPPARMDWPARVRT